MQNDLKSESFERIIAIIPARGGSKGIPRKNLRLMAGDPLLVHTIRHAQKATLVQRVIVTTEDQDIAEVAKAAGAELVIRPMALATDDSPSELALLHVLEKLELDEKYYADVIVFLQCTSPLRSSDDIDRAIEKLFIEHADTLFSASRSISSDERSGEVH